MKNSVMDLWAVEVKAKDGTSGWWLNADGTPQLFTRRVDARNNAALLGGVPRRVWVQVRRQY